jgi:DNA recombination-dependent growth factor C
MFFRNLTLFRFPTSLDLSDLDELLAAHALKPVGPLEMSSRGFVAPLGHDAEALTHRIGDAIWVTVGGEDKILPGAVVNDLLGKKLAQIEQREGRKPGGRTRKRLKDDLLHELLPRAFVRPVAHRRDARPQARPVRGRHLVAQGRRGGGAEIRPRWAASRRCRSTPRSRRAAC